MSEKTLNDYLTALNSEQQDYIVFCVKTHGDRAEFHRGLLPFLPAKEAADCLKFQLEHLKATQAIVDNPTMVYSAVKGEKFIRTILSKFANALLYPTDDGTETIFLHLKSTKMKRYFGKRYGHKFSVTAQEFGWQIAKKPISGLVELQMVSRNKWRVTGPSGFGTSVASQLQDMFGDYP